MISGAVIPLHSDPIITALTRPQHQIKTFWSLCCQLISQNQSVNPKKQTQNFKINAKTGLQCALQLVETPEISQNLNIKHPGKNVAQEHATRKKTQATRNFRKKQA